MATLSALELVDEKESLPWDSWPRELPAAGEPVDCPEYDALNDRENMRKVWSEVRQAVFERATAELEHCADGVMLLAGGSSEDFALYDSDTPKCGFRQEAYFRYVFGLNEPNALGVLDLARRKVVLFIKAVPKAAERWLGATRPHSYYTSEYGVDECLFVSAFGEWLEAREVRHVYLLDGVNSDSGTRVTTKVLLPDAGDGLEVDRCGAHSVLTECRVHKTRAEMELLRAASLVSSKAHVYVMRHAAVGMFERQLEALFKAYSYYFGGSRQQAYECICGSGANGATLHYGHSGYPNDRRLVAGDMLLLDMGSEYNGYCTDITCSFPANGRFTPAQRSIFQIVRKQQLAVFSQMKAGVSYCAMHRLAERTLVEGMLEVGILKAAAVATVSGKVDALMAANVATVFMPHGLGHLLGLNVHDVGGFTDAAPRSKEAGLRWLRTTRTLETGMFITVEPGIYFNEAWIKQCLQKRPELEAFIDFIKLKPFLGTGGIRLEDDVLVTDTGIENLTICPRTVEHIEAVMRGD